MVKRNGSVDSTTNPLVAMEVLEEGEDTVQGTEDVGMLPGNRLHVGEFSKGILAPRKLPNSCDGLDKRFPKVERLDMVGAFLPAMSVEVKH